MAETGPAARSVSRPRRGSGRPGARRTDAFAAAPARRSGLRAGFPFAVARTADQAGRHDDRQAAAGGLEQKVNTFIWEKER